MKVITSLLHYHVGRQMLLIISSETTKIKTMLGKLHRLIDLQETKQTFAQEQSSKDKFRTTEIGSVNSRENKNSGLSWRESASRRSLS